MGIYGNYVSLTFTVMYKKNLSMAILALVMYMYTVKIAPKKPVQCQLTNSPVYWFYTSRMSIKNHNHICHL